MSVPYTTACRSDQRLSKKTLLSILDSRIDPTRAIVLETGEVVNIEELDIRQINRNYRDKIWVPYEERQPRRMLLTNPNWSILSFSPTTKQICVQLISPVGTRVLNFTVPFYYYL